ncbi:unnamed protein product (macronuclear) [Paramecium tetraurelia]|uniref:Transmembrane protein n=1 Tax=Paramecium tetraurelia TaxID=5888 RepID=A0ECM0_PARTE|nr:uncharacterized protein GSPATT00003906001 [Paramecium tetraurelia]CAK93037.1 unnamed protein product [Paramecium tetraurelia]|eukprot:XP_001460434.1 hypothetical protein (macronuclear) [Paramecium tetraurelia strain d4-2]
MVLNISFIIHYNIVRSIGAFKFFYKGEQKKKSKIMLSIPRKFSHYYAKFYQESVKTQKQSQLYQIDDSKKKRGLTEMQKIKISAALLLSIFNQCFQLQIRWIKRTQKMEIKKTEANNRNKQKCINRQIQNHKFPHTQSSGYLIYRIILNQTNSVSFPFEVATIGNQKKNSKIRGQNINSLPSQNRIQFKSFQGIKELYSLQIFNIHKTKLTIISQRNEPSEDQPFKFSQV